MLGSNGIRVKVEQILRDATVIEPPIPVERLAKRLGAQLRYEPFRGELSGLLFRENGRTIIGVNSLHSRPRQRFTIAHELGHLLLHDRDDLHIDKNFRVERRDATSSQGTDWKEIAANRFAAELLIPAPMIDQDTRGLSVDYESDDLVRRLAIRYDVSLQAMIIRLTRLGIIKEDGNLPFG